MTHSRCRACFLVLAMFCLAGAYNHPPAPSSAKPGTPAPAPAPAPAVVAEESYLDRLAVFKTKLVRVGPAPQHFEPATPPKGVQEITYPSGDLALKAWVAFPEASAGKTKVPAVVYFHGGFSFGAADFEEARPFLDAGFAVMCPTLRGENGNPGAFELYLSEVNDAKAAVAWIAANEKVDASRIYTFGHSAGGVISALLSLRDAPIRYGGSSGGLYGTDIFARLSEWLPFALEDASERPLRVLVGNIRWMKHPHYAYIGDADHLQAGAAAQKEIDPAHPLLTIIPTPGTHFTSLAPAIKSYIQVLKEKP